MLYKVARAQIHNNGTVTVSKRNLLKVYPCKLQVGGLYFLGPGLPGKRELYKVIEELGTAPTE